MKRLFLSVIMPALNEERNILSAISNTLGALDHFDIDGEIIVVNDGSTDKTEDLINDIAGKHTRVKMFKHDMPQGIGASFWDGVDSAIGNIVVMIPGDNENDPTEIFRYTPLLEHVDIVVPFIFNREVRSIFRNAVSFMYRFIINTTFLVNFNYTNGTVLYRKSILKDVDYRSKSFFFQTDILVRMGKKGYLFAEVPYRLDLRKEGISKAVSFPSFLKVAQGYLRLVRDYYGKKSAYVDLADDSMTSVRHNDRRRLGD